MGRTIGQQRGPGARPLGASGPQSIVTPSQAVPQIGTDISPGLPADSGYFMGGAQTQQPVGGPAQNQFGGGGAMDTQLDPNLMLKQRPFFGNAY